MKRSTDRILTTHVGSLPRPDDIIPMLQARDAGQPHDERALAGRITTAVNEVVRKQAEVGVDVVNDGEHNKSVYSGYLGPGSPGSRRGRGCREIGLLAAISSRFPPSTRSADSCRLLGPARRRPGAGVRRWCASGPSRTSVRSSCRRTSRT